MTLQHHVSTGMPGGVPGSRAGFGPVVYYPNTLVGETPVSVGGFVWPGTNAAVQAKCSGTGVPLGFVERSSVYPNFDIMSSGSLDVPAGAALAIAVKGDYWAVSATDAVVGHKVYVSLAGGDIATYETGKSLSGFIETAWAVVTNGEAGEPIIISNWSE